MNIAVCIKQVQGKVKIEIDPQTNTLLKTGSDPIMNPLDMYALEEAIRLKEKHQGKVTAIGMGPPEAHQVLREAIAVGADEGILASDPAFENSDTWATSLVLSRVMKKTGQFDLVICGKQSIDGETGQVGPQLAEFLGLPFVGCVSKIEDTGAGTMKVVQMVDDGHQVVETALPAVISVVKEINVPRLPSLRGTMASKKATIPVMNGQSLDLDPKEVGLSGSPTRILKVFVPQRGGQSEMLQGSMEAQVDQLLVKLKEVKVI
jgi:electron transfer flavoprotein beta subunit